MRLLLLLPPLLLLLPFLLLLLHYEEHKNAVEKNEKGWCEKLDAWCCWMLNADEGVLSWSFARSYVFSSTVVKTTCHEHLRECVSAYTNTNTIAACPWQHEARENVEAEENARNGSKHFLFSLFCLLFSMVPTVSRSKIVMWSSAGDDDWLQWANDKMTAQITQKRRKNKGQCYFIKATEVVYRLNRVCNSFHLISIWCSNFNTKNSFFKLSFTWNCTVF